MALKLKEVSLTDASTVYSTEFFATVAKQEEGKFFAFERPLPETTIRSRAKQAGEALGVKFTIVTVPPAVPGGADSYAVGVTTKTRKPRSANKQKVAEPAPAESPAPVVGDWLLAEGGQPDQIEALDAIVDQEAI